MMLKLPSREATPPVLVAVNTDQIISARPWREAQDHTVVVTTDGRMTIFAVPFDEFVRCANDLERSR